MTLRTAAVALVLALCITTSFGAQWRFGSNYVPQHYGNWQFTGGNWNFGNDKRIECEACGYTMYMLIDRLGDQFNKVTLETEMKLLCPRVQWVFKSACSHILATYKDQLIELVMRLTEPEDICKQIALCAPDFFDAAAAGAGAAGSPGVMSAAGMGMPWQGYGMGMGAQAHGYPVSAGVPGVGFTGHATKSGVGLYPPAGSHPMNANSPYSPYSFGGYDSFGFPTPSSGVPSSTPMPPMAGAEAAPAA